MLWVSVEAASTEAEIGGQQWVIAEVTVRLFSAPFLLRIGDSCLWVGIEASHTEPKISTEVDCESLLRSNSTELVTDWVGCLFWEHFFITDWWDITQNDLVILKIWRAMRVASHHKKNMVKISRSGCMYPLSELKSCFLNSSITALQCVVDTTDA